MLTYWTEKDENTVDDVLTAYQRLIGDLDTYSNIVTYFFGGEYWLIGNSSNYTDSMTTNKLISQKILLYAFCDGAYSINSTAAQSTLESLRTIIQAQRLTPTQYPDFSGLDIIFFGDSIIGNYTGSSSVPGVVSGLSGAHTYNCGIGGVAAAKSTEAELDFPAMATAFITGDLSAIPTETPFRDAFHAYRENADSDNELCFIINYGLNDYFNGLPLSNPAELGDITTYAGALREGISLLQESYPDAHIILMGPTFSTAFSYGTEITSEKGSVLTDYVDTAQLVAEETNILFMNNYLNMGINKDNAALYLPDGTHLNESGRFLLAQHIIEKLHSATVQ